MEERKEERKAIKRATEEGSKISRVRRVIKPEEKLAVKLMEGERERERVRPRRSRCNPKTAKGQVRRRKQPTHKRTNSQV